MTVLEYLQAQACTVAWNSAHRHGLNAMVAVLHALRNAADLRGEWAAIVSEYGGPSLAQPDVRNPDFQNLLKIAPQIITDLSQPLGRVVDRHFYLNFSETPPSTGGALTIGGLFFY